MLFATEGETAESVDVDAATRALRFRADAKDEMLFNSGGFEGTRAFYERYLRLSAVFVTAEVGSGDSRATLWINRSARISIAEFAARACLRCLQGDI